MAKYSQRQFLLATTVAASALVFAACPGTERVTSPSNQIVTDTLSAMLMATGSVQTGAEGSGMPAQAFPSSDIVVGDQDGNVNGTAVRGMIGFDLTGLPTGIMVQGATLTAQQCAINGDPFNNLGDVIVRHMSYAVPFDTTVFFKTALDSTIDTLTTTVTLGLHSIVVTSSVASDVAANRGASQYRLQMSSSDLNIDGISDNVVFATDSVHTFDCKAVGGQQPKLIIVYHKP